MKNIKNMEKWGRRHRYKIRFIYWLVVFLTFIFIVLPIFFFFYLFDENQVKQLIVDQFDNNNYHVEVVGHVAPKFWHGLSLEFQDIKIDTKNYATLVKVKNMSCQLSWFDLVFAQYKVRRMALNGVEIDDGSVLKRAYAGNLFNLSKPQENIFSRISIVNVYGIYTLGNKFPYKLSDGTIRIKRNSVSVSFELAGTLVDSKLHVLISGNTHSFTQNKIGFDEFRVSLYGAEDFQLQLNSTASYDISKNQLILSQALGNISSNSHKSEVRADKIALSRSLAEIEKLSLKAHYANALVTHDLSIATNHLTLNDYSKLYINKINTNYTVTYNNSKLELISSLGDIRYNESSAMISAISCTNLVNISSPNFASATLRGLLSGNCNYSAKLNLLDLNFVGKLNEAPLRLKMQLYNQTKPHLILSGNMDKLDLSRIKVNKEKFLPLLYDKRRLPFDWLSLINIDGNLMIKEFMLDRISLNNLATKFVVANNTLNVREIRADVYKGVLNGQAKIEKFGENEYNISAKQTINNVSLQDMFSDLFDVQAISGLANLLVDITAPKIHAYNDLYHNLNGSIRIGASHGVFQGVDFNLFVNPGGMSLTNKKSTAFEQLQASFNFVDGVSDDGRVNFSSKYVIATGGGMVDFDNVKMNYTLSIKSALPRNNEKINSVLIPVTVSGNLFNPKVNIKNIHLYTRDIVAPKATNSPPGHRKSTRKSAKTKLLQKKLHKHQLEEGV